MNVGAIRAVLKIAVVALQDVHVLTVIRPGPALGAHDVLPIAISVADLRSDSTICSIGTPSFSCIGHATECRGEFALTPQVCNGGFDAWPRNVVDEDRICRPKVRTAQAFAYAGVTFAERVEKSVSDKCCRPAQTVFIGYNDIDGVVVGSQSGGVSSSPAIQIDKSSPSRRVFAN